MSRNPTKDAGAQSPVLPVVCCAHETTTPFVCWSSVDGSASAFAEGTAAEANDPVVRFEFADIGVLSGRATSLPLDID